MDHWVIRYTDTKRVVRLVPILAEDTAAALRSFSWFVKDAIEDTITVLTMDEFKDLREAYGFNRDEPTDDEYTALERRIRQLYNSPEFQAKLQSGGYDEY